MIPRDEKHGRLPDGVAILLRPYQPDDAALVYEAACESVAEIAPWMAWCHAGYSLEEARSRAELRPAAWERGSEYDFVIVESATGQVLGACGLNNIHRENRMANLGYWVRTTWARRGVASTAARLVAEFGFEQLHLNRIEIVVAVGNYASQRAAEKAGALREGVLRNRLMVRDVVHDAVMFSLIPPNAEYEVRKEKRHRSIADS